MDLLAAMRVFVRVVERGNLSRAAKDLDLGQPTVSDRIERLEQHLGMRLLRSTRAVSCTDEGSLSYRKSKLVLDDDDDAREAVALGGQAVRGRIRIAAPHGLGDVVLPAMLGASRVQHPELHVDFVATGPACGRDGRSAWPARRWRSRGGTGLLNNLLPLLGESGLLIVGGLAFVLSFLTMLTYNRRWPPATASAAARAEA